MSLAAWDETAQTADDVGSEMERIADRLKDLILSQPPRELLGYLSAQLSLRSVVAPEGSADAAQEQREAEATRLALGYVHAVLCCFDGDASAQFSEQVCDDIIGATDELYEAARRFAGNAMHDETSGARSEVESRAKAHWLSAPDDRSATRQQEFLAFALDPHDAALRKTYGVGAADIAAGLCDIAASMRAGGERAAALIAEHGELVNALAAERALTPEQAVDALRSEQPERVAAAERVYSDLIAGNICNVSRHTRLPPALLQDLACERGENEDFFAPGPLCGTPLRTLPARVKPFVKLGDDCFAPDPGFIAGSAYRQILWNLIGHNPSPAFRRDFDGRQRRLSENAYPDVLAEQLKGATIQHAICYRDAATRQWVENDTLIRLEDVLILVEAKPGAAAEIAAPGADFEHHVRGVENMMTAAYAQCRRFFDYLASADEVPLFRREGGRYVAFDRIRLTDYRVMLPVGLTIESLSPYADLCGTLPGIEPLLGRHAFIPMSVDDLFMLRRSLPAAGEFLHYMSARQSMAGDASAAFLGEAECLAAYRGQNRNDAAPPPEEVSHLLAALDAAAEPGWMDADRLVRGYPAERAAEMAQTLRRAGENLSVQESFWFVVAGDPPLFVWLQRFGTLADPVMIAAKAKAAAVAASSSAIVAIVAHATSATEYSRAAVMPVEVPPSGSAEYERARAEAERLKDQANPATIKAAAPMPPARPLGRNERCWCGSGKKFKRCHGAHA